MVAFGVMSYQYIQKKQTVWAITFGALALRKLSDAALQSSRLGKELKSIWFFTLAARPVPTFHQGRPWSHHVEHR